MELPFPIDGLPCTRFHRWFLYDTDGDCIRPPAVLYCVQHQEQARETGRVATELLKPAAVPERGNPLDVLGAQRLENITFTDYKAAA